MKVPETFREYICLLKTIRKARKITFDEIQEKCADSTSKCYCVHLEVSETPAVSFYRTFTDADTIMYRYSFASNRPSTVLQSMTTALV